MSKRGRLKVWKAMKVLFFHSDDVAELVMGYSSIKGQLRESIDPNSALGIYLDKLERLLVALRGALK